MKNTHCEHWLFLALSSVEALSGALPSSAIIGQAVAINHHLIMGQAVAILPSYMASIKSIPFFNT
jgi:hypothetical protein